MSSLSLLRGKTRFAGAYSAVATYMTGDVVEYTDGAAYVCNNDGVSGGTFPGTNWTLFIPTITSVPITAAAMTDAIDTSATFGIAAGGTKSYVAGKYTITLSGTTVTLNKFHQNCNCNCQCNCSAKTQCNCSSNCTTGSDCKTQLCLTRCPNGSGVFVNCNCLCSDCTGSDCKHLCHTNCNCSTNCNCNCSPIGTTG